MAEKVPVYDNHIHMSPSGRNVDALREFEAAGGTGLTLVTLPHREVPITSGSDFARSYEVTYGLAERAREATDLEVNIAVGPYPVLLIHLAEVHGLERAEAMMMEGMEAAGRDVAEGRAVAIGEIGFVQRAFDRVPLVLVRREDDGLFPEAEVAADIGADHREAGRGQGDFAAIEGKIAALSDKTLAVTDLLSGRESGVRPHVLAQPRRDDQILVKLNVESIGLLPKVSRRLVEGSFVGNEDEVGAEIGKDGISFAEGKAIIPVQIALLRAGKDVIDRIFDILGHDLLAISA